MQLPIDDTSIKKTTPPDIEGEKLHEFFKICTDGVEKEWREWSNKKDSLFAYL
jgi:hypothetical protein